MVRPTSLGMIIEARDQVRINVRVLLRWAISTRFASLASTKGPFFIERDMPLSLSSAPDDHTIRPLVIPCPIPQGRFAPRRLRGAFFYQLVGDPEGLSQPPRDTSDETASSGPEATDVRVRPHLSTHAETLERLRDWGLPVVPHWRRCVGIDELVAFCREWADKRRTLDFETDGVSSRSTG